MKMANGLSSLIILWESVLLREYWDFVYKLCLYGERIVTVDDGEIM